LEGIENEVTSRNEATNEVAEKMKKICDEAAAVLEKTQKTMKKYYDARRRDALEFKVGDKVWLEVKDVVTDRPTKRFDDLRLGPYEILEKVGASAYKLRLPGTDLSYPVFNSVVATPTQRVPSRLGEVDLSRVKSSHKCDSTRLRSWHKSTPSHSSRLKSGMK
jgi:hypothetical protein